MRKGNGKGMGNVSGECPFVFPGLLDDSEDLPDFVESARLHLHGHAL